MSVAPSHLHAEVLRAVEELASGAAHHLNNLLAVVLGHVQLALLKTDDPEIRRHLATAERAAQDGADLVRRLARFGRTRPTPPILVDLGQIAEEVLDWTLPGWKASGAECPVQITIDATPVPPVAGDPSLLSEVLTNLVLNSIDAMPNGGILTIKIWTARDRVFCSISDTGVGMPPDVQRRALEPFFTTKGVKSIGLGLSACYGILRGHGGELSIESAAGCGTIATFDLPIGNPEDATHVECAARGVTPPE